MHKPENFTDRFFKSIKVRQIYNSNIPIIIIAAHPDDETIGAFSILYNFTNIKIIHTTDGAPKNMIDAGREGFSSRVDYALQRREELHDVVSCLNIPESNCSFLAISDQEASFHLDVLTLKIVEDLDKFKPQFVFTHAYEGGHPDHDATAFAVRAACRMLQREINKAPVIIDFPVYNSYSGSFEMNKFAPYESCAELVLSLDETTYNFKKEVLENFKTQQYLIKSYSSTIESFRAAPDYDFTKPPYKGKIHYDDFDWGIKSDEWRELASAAMGLLNLESKI